VCVEEGCCAFEGFELEPSEREGSWEGERLAWEKRVGVDKGCRAIDENEREPLGREGVFEEKRLAWGNRGGVDLGAGGRPKLEKERVLFGGECVGEKTYRCLFVLSAEMDSSAAGVRASRPGGAACASKIFIIAAPPSLEAVILMGGQRFSYKSLFWYVWSLKRYKCPECNTMHAAVHTSIQRHGYRSKESATHIQNTYTPTCVSVASVCPASFL